MPWPPIRPPARTSRRWSGTCARAAKASPWSSGGPGRARPSPSGIARHAWQLDGYRLLAAAPTGIATISLQGEGFEDVATCDRLLADLDRGQETLDSRTVLVVDEAGMVGSRKLTRLLEHADQAQAKVVLVGDDRQLAAIDAGGGFRALRLRLGASELVENRRQHQAWEREALDLIRSGLMEEAVAAYQAHDRVVAADSKPAATLSLLQDWWAAYQHPVVVPHRPTEQVLHPIRAGVPGVLGDRPAVLARQIRQQPEHERLGPLSWLHPAEPPRDPAPATPPALPAIGQALPLRCGLRPPSDLWLST